MVVCLRFITYRCLESKLLTIYLCDFSMPTNRLFNLPNLQVTLTTLMVIGNNLGRENKSSSDCHVFHTVLKHPVYSPLRICWCVLARGVQSNNLKNGVDTPLLSTLDESDMMHRPNSRNINLTEIYFGIHT